MTAITFCPSVNQNQIVSNLITVCPDGIIGVDSRGTVVLFNHQAALLTRRNADDVLGHLDIGEIYGSREKARQIKAAIISDAFGGKDRLDGMETEMVDVDGNVVPIRLSAVLLRDNGRHIGSVGFFHDMTHKKTLEEKLRVLSITDGLTQLFNHRHFHLCLATELERSIRYGRPLSLICFDLDCFKEANDRLGHLEGDRILRRIGELLRSVTRQSDKAFRYGGDEFCVLLPETQRSQAVATAEKIRRLFNAYNFQAAACGADGPIRVTLSIGVVERRIESTGNALIKRADLAMYAAKNQGGDCVVAG